MIPANNVVLPEQYDLIKKTVAKDATKDELELFLYDCQRQGVHPLDKLIHFTKRGGRYTPITSIDFMRMKALQTGAYAGCSNPTFTGTIGKDDYTCTMSVYRFVQGEKCEFSATVRYAEYCPPKGQDHLWARMQSVMLQKVCESVCLRRGFADTLHGLYTHEEMAQAVRPSQKIAPVSLRQKLGIEAVPEDVEEEISLPEPVANAWIDPPQIELQVVAQPETSMTVWPVGKHKGVPLADVPSAYLEWGVKNLTTAVLRLAAITELLQRKEAEGEA